MTNKADAKTRNTIISLYELIAWITLLENIVRDTKTTPDKPGTWRFIYALTFDIFYEKITPIFETVINKDFTWYDPDGSYRDDVIALVNALSEYKPDIMITLHAFIDMAVDG